jgi:hypothetical protein
VNGDCNDNNPCTTDLCSGGGCQNIMVTNGTSCPDANPCNGVETCQNGVCTGAAPLICDDGNVCTTDSCDPASGCRYVAVTNGSGCGDGNLCNGNELCQGGVCTGGGALNCNDGSVCTIDSCAPALGCQHGNLANGTSCTDGNVCNGAESCQNGVCGGGTPLDCNDGNPCTADSCDPVLGCGSSPVPDGTSCADGNACNGAETCVGGTCQGGTPPNCDDVNVCTTDSCDPFVGCRNVAVPDGLSCADGTVCNGAETCQAGVCTGGTPLNCDDGNPCTTDTCNDAAGCQTTLVPNGTSCGPGLVCQNGTCVSSCIASTTGFLNPTAQEADTGGDGNGFEVSPTNAFADEGGTANNINGTGDRHRYFNYNVTIPAGCTVRGIEVRLDWRLDSTFGTNSMSVELSGDGGATFTAGQVDTQETTSLHTVVLGSPSDTWGRSWTAAELGNVGFRVRVTSTSSSSFRDFFLDWVPVRVSYGP